MPILKKVQAIQDIAPPKTKKQLRRFIGMVNYYRDMWVCRSEILTPLTALTPKEAKWVWTDINQKEFDKMKKIVAREVLLSYPNFDNLFEIHMDASTTQLGAVIDQKSRPIALYSRKLNPTQTRYTTTKHKLLSKGDIMHMMIWTSIGCFSMNVWQFMFFTIELASLC